MTCIQHTATRLLTLGGATTLAFAAAAQTAELPSYVPARQVSGTLRICGSPQMGDLLKAYEEGFSALEPGVRFDEHLTSTVTAIADAANGHADIGLLGREIWPTEVRAFESARGHPPTVIDVATGSYDVPRATFALMIFVPAANPLASLSASQLERIFAASRRPITTWGQLGLKGQWTARPIHLYGFAVDNDKSRIFSQLVFNSAESWSPRLKQLSNGAGPGGADAGQLILDAVAKDPDAIGISNVHYATGGVRAMALTTPEHQAPITPTREHVADRSYPLTRAIYMVLDSDPANPAAVEFLRYVLSRQGQQAVIKEGNYIPLPSLIAAGQLQRLSAGPR